MRVITAFFSNDSEPPKKGTATIAMKMYSDKLVLFRNVL